MTCRCQPFKQHLDCPIHVAAISRGLELASGSFIGGASMVPAVLELADASLGPEDLAPGLVSSFRVYDDPDHDPADERPLFQRLMQAEQDAGLGARAGEYDAFAERQPMREVTLEYLTELQSKADSLTAVRRWLDAEYRCTRDASAKRMIDALDRKYGPLP